MRVNAPAVVVDGTMRIAHHPTARRMPDHDIPTKLAARVDATDLHGAVCGLLCGSADLTHIAARRDLTRLLRTALDDVDAELREYIQSCRDSLGADDFSFVPLIAGDDDPIERRLESLTRWCESFVEAFQLTAPQLDEVAEEAFEDIVATAELDEESEPDDDTEADLAQVAEHVKIAVLVVHDAVHGASDDE